MAKGLCLPRVTLGTCRIADVLDAGVDVTIRPGLCRSWIAVRRCGWRGWLRTRTARDQQWCEEQDPVPSTEYCVLATESCALKTHGCSRLPDKRVLSLPCSHLVLQLPYSALKTVTCLMVSGRRRVTSPCAYCSSSPSQEISSSRPR